MSDGPPFLAVARYPDRWFESQPATSLEDAIDYGLSEGQGLPFDVHLPTGAVAWTWEQRTAEQVVPEPIYVGGDYMCDHLDAKQCSGCRAFAADIARARQRGYTPV